MVDVDYQKPSLVNGLAGRPIASMPYAEIAVQKELTWTAKPRHAFGGLPGAMADRTRKT